MLTNHLEIDGCALTHFTQSPTESLTESLWLVGPSRCDKTTVLLELLCDRLPSPSDPTPTPERAIARSPLVFAANGDNRIALADRIAQELPHDRQGRASVYVTTPLGFFDSEVQLYWTLLESHPGGRVPFPLRLRPETEQMLATQLWQDDLDAGGLRELGGTQARQVRRALDVLQLASAAGFPPEAIADRLAEGLEAEGEMRPDWEMLQDLLLCWTGWCRERGLLTYATACELYWRELLPHPQYQQQLQRRFSGVFADDVDEYPAIARHLFETLLDLGCHGAFTFNNDGRVRLGLNADPDYLEGLAGRCRLVDLQPAQRAGLAGEWGDAIVDLALDPTYLMQLPASVPSIQTVTRSQLLRQAAEFVAQAIEDKKVKPEEVAIVAPGLDAIARYTLTRILDGRGVPVRSLNVQRPLVSNPSVRAMLTLLALLYPGLGRTINRDLVAEMLVVLSAKFSRPLSNPAIDPVRAGAIADACYRPDFERPELLPLETFERWDRLGFRATEAYRSIGDWIAQVRYQLAEERTILSPVVTLDRIANEFVWHRDLSEDRLEALRELLETATHFWDVERRVRASQSSRSSRRTDAIAVGEFIALLQQGTVCANPYPVRSVERPAVVLSTIYQYRVSRLRHRWHLWLDISSPLWLRGGAAQLFAAPLFERSRDRFPYTAEDAERDDESRLRRILYDLLSRVDDRVVLCHSDLAVNGQEQMGRLLALANASVSLDSLALRSESVS